jgi:hypothetical protein
MASPHAMGLTRMTMRKSTVANSGMKRNLVSKVANLQQGAWIL